MWSVLLPFCWRPPNSWRRRTRRRPLYPTCFGVNCPCSKVPWLLELLSWSLSILDVKTNCGGWSRSQLIQLPFYFREFFVNLRNCHILRKRWRMCLNPFLCRTLKHKRAWWYSRCASDLPWRTPWLPPLWTTKLRMVNVSNIFPFNFRVNPVKTKHVPQSQ